jgi:hypothetical protein
MVSVIPIPIILCPLMVCIDRKYMLRILNLRSVLLAELLT